MNLNLKRAAFPNGSGNKSTETCVDRHETSMVIMLFSKMESNIKSPLRMLATASIKPPRPSSKSFQDEPTSVVEPATSTEAAQSPLKRLAPSEMLDNGSFKSKKERLSIDTRKPELNEQMKSSIMMKAKQQAIIDSRASNRFY